VKYLLVIALLFFTSCSGIVTGRTFTQIKPGMSQEASMQKLGNAQDVIKKDGLELHKYKDVYGPKSFHPGCSKCTMMGKCDYFVVYKQGKVVEYGQMHHRFNPNPLVTKVFF